MFNDYIPAIQQFYNSSNEDLTLDDFLGGHEKSLIGSQLVWDQTGQSNKLKSRGLRYLFDDCLDKDYRALDFGCGVGRHISMLRDHFSRIDGCDVSSFLVGLAKENMRRCGIDNDIHLISDRLDEIEDGSFDVVYSLYVFQHIVIRSLRNFYLQQLFDKLRPGGKLRGQFGMIGIVHRDGKMDYFNEQCPEWAGSSYGFVESHREQNIVDDLHKIGFVNVETTVHHNQIEETWRYCQNDLFLRADKP